MHANISCSYLVSFSCFCEPRLRHGWDAKAMAVLQGHPGMQASKPGRVHPSRQRRAVIVQTQAPRDQFRPLVGNIDILPQSNDRITRDKQGATVSRGIEFCQRGRPTTTIQRKRDKLKNTYTNTNTSTCTSTSTKHPLENRYLP